jgi:hypothetical protein
MINQELYQVAFNQLTSKGVPVSTAQRASLVVAKDDPSKPNLGRTEKDQSYISDAMIWMSAKQKESKDGYS